MNQDDSVRGARVGGVLCSHGGPPNGQCFATFHARAHRFGRPTWFSASPTSASIDASAYLLHFLRTGCSFSASFQAASSGCGPGRHPIYGPIHGAASVIRLEIASVKTAPLRGGEVGLLSGTPGRAGQGDPRKPSSP